MDVILCFFHWIPRGAVRSWRSLPRCSDRRAVRGGLRSSPCPSVFSSPPRRRGVPRRWWLVFLFCSFSSWRHHEVTPPDAIARWHRLTPLRDDIAAQQVQANNQDFVSLCFSFAYYHFGYSYHILIIMFVIILLLLSLLLLLSRGYAVAQFVRVVAFFKI